MLFRTLLLPWGGPTGWFSRLRSDRSSAWCAALAGWISLALATVAWAEPFHYAEDFEQADPVQFWTTNGKYEVHFKGLTDEEAHGGRRAFKLDVTLKKGTYLYWHVPVRVPAEGRLRFSAWIKVLTLPRGASVGLGANYTFPPTRHSGCGPFETLRNTTAKWVHVTGNLAQEAGRRAESVTGRYIDGATSENVALWVDRWAIFIFARPGQRIVCYVDDVVIEGDTPNPTEYQRVARERFQPVRERLLRKLAEQKQTLDRLAGDLAGYQRRTRLPAVAQRLAQYAEQTVGAARTLIERLQRIGYGSPSEVAELRQRIDLLAHVVPNLKRLAASGEGRSLIVFVSRPITNARILPNSFPIPGRIDDELHVTACPGEYEPATFTVLAVQKLQDLTVQIDPLRCAAGELSPDCVDVRVVKCWFQGKGNIGRSTERVLKPELLLKDDALVRVDLEKKRNFVRTTDASGRPVSIEVSRDLDEGASDNDLKDLRPRDADQLQPVDIPARQAKQFWITVRVPDDARPGTYQGTIRLRSTGGEQARLRLSVRVLRFRLEPSPLLYSIYYTGRLAPDGKPSISSKWKSEQQMLAELRNMKAHGVLFPTSYQPYDERLLRRTLELRREAGLPTGPFFSLGITTGNATDPKRLAAKQAEVRKWLTLIREYDYTDLFAYGFDEARGERLKSQRAAWKAVQDAGGKTFVAGYRGTFEVMGGLLDCLVFAGAPQPDEAAKWHSVGSLILSYANPQVGVEEPETYRRNYGLLLWKAGFDGAMDFAYQYHFGHIWNDFDHPRYRDHNFTYPTVDGVIDTLAWEGFREGVDDVRYLATLQKAIRDAQSSGRRKDAVRAAKAWIEKLDPAGDLDALRSQMISLILRLRGEDSEPDQNNSRPN
ncbi:MAG: hypothetical protein GXP27_14065 [Planctomycetes bacterium]|nr:hypothetical protein [Planctomycetota bacterium]